MSGNYTKLFSLNKVQNKIQTELDVDELMTDVPGFRERKKLASENPYEAARYFKYIIDLLITHIFGWNRKEQDPGEKPGLFGFTKGFCGATESQNSGNLHAHFIIWIYGLPKTGTEYNDIMKTNPSLLVKYCSNILK
jgi:hypothetical protein